MWTKPICDRTQKDIEDGSDKGFCNAADLNRLEDNCKEVGTILGVALNMRSGRWSAADLPTESELARITRNIGLLNAAYRAYATTPQSPANPLNSWQKWNDAEKILLDIRNNYMDNIAARSYSGELIAGERIGII